MRDGRYRIDLHTRDADSAGSATVARGTLNGRSDAVRLEGRISGIDALCVAELTVAPPIDRQMTGQVPETLVLVGHCDETGFQLSTPEGAEVDMRLEGTWLGA